MRLTQPPNTGKSFPAAPRHLFFGFYVISNRLFFLWVHMSGINSKFDTLEKISGEYVGSSFCTDAS